MMCISNNVHNVHIELLQTESVQKFPKMGTCFGKTEVTLVIFETTIHFKFYGVATGVYLNCMKHGKFATCAAMTTILL